jgi:cyclopropane fatty-acyl-phospholipid synthase-like methyltransferase
MPYAAKDRQEFIKRSNLNPDARILDFGGMLSEELTDVVIGITSRRPISNAVLIRPMLLPFKNSVFSAIVSYHYFDLVSSGKLDFVFEEAARVLEKDASFSFMILHWAANNEAQKSNLLFNEVLKSIGALYKHDLEEISIKLNKAGFTEITVESIRRDITVPQEFTNEHLLMLGNLVKIEKTQGGEGLKALAKQYFHKVKEHGEAMLPAIHFVAKK